MFNSFLFRELVLFCAKCEFYFVFSYSSKITAVRNKINPNRKGRSKIAYLQMICLCRKP